MFSSDQIKVVHVAFSEVSRGEKENGREEEGGKRCQALKVAVEQEYC